MIKRHYVQKRLKNYNDQLAPSQLVWNLSPYEVAHFAGELSKVMLEAAQRYITEQSIAKQHAIFAATAFHGRRQETEGRNVL